MSQVDNNSNNNNNNKAKLATNPPSKNNNKKRYSIIINTGAKKLQANHVKLYTPKLKDLISVIEKQLKLNFENVTIKEVDCPDLQQWCGLAEKGLCGQTRIADIGGIPYMLDPAYSRTTYQIPDIVSTCGMEKALVIGAGAASSLVVGKNAELMANTFAPGPRHSRFAKIDKADDDKNSDSDDVLDDPNEPLDGISVDGIKSPTPAIAEGDENSESNDNKKKEKRKKKNQDNNNNNDSDGDDDDDDDDNNNDIPVHKRNSLSQNDAKKIILQQMQNDPEKKEHIENIKKRQSLSQDNKKQQEILQKLQQQQQHLDEIPHVGLYPSEEMGCLANFFLSDGKQGPVIYIKVSKRIGEDNFTNTIREGLKKYPECKDEQQIGLGGVFKLNKGKIKSHIMRDFMKKKCPESDSETINKWLKWFEVGPNLLMLSVIISDDPTHDKRLHLRCEHTHFYSLNKNVNEGGHYHYDITPDDVEYEGYFSLAEYIYRIEDAYYNMASSPMPSKDEK